MTPVSQIADRSDFPFSLGRGSKASCGLRLFEARSTGKVVAVVTDHEGVGARVASGIEVIASRICKEYDVEPERLLVIEHTPEEEVAGSIFDEHYALVSFDYNPRRGFRSPSWNPLTPEDVARLTETAIDLWRAKAETEGGHS